MLDNCSSQTSIACLCPTTNTCELRTHHNLDPSWSVQLHAAPRSVGPQFSHGPLQKRASYTRQDFAPTNRLPDATRKHLRTHQGTSASDCGSPLCSAGAKNLYRRSIANPSIIEAAALLPVTATNYKWSFCLIFVNLATLASASVTLFATVPKLSSILLNCSWSLNWHSSNPWWPSLRTSPHLLTATTLSLSSEFLEWLTTDDSVLQHGIPGLTNLSKVVYVENETWARPQLLHPNLHLKSSLPSASRWPANQLALFPNTSAFAMRGLPAKLTCSRGTRRFCEEEGLCAILPPPKYTATSQMYSRKLWGRGQRAIPLPPKYSRLSLTKPRYLRSGDLSLHPSETHNQPTAQHKWRLLKQTHAQAVDTHITREPDALKQPARLHIRADENVWNTSLVAH